MMDFLSALGTCAVLWGGVHRVWAGSLQAGDLVVFTYYVKNLFGPIRDLAKQSSRIAKATRRTPARLRLCRAG